MMRVVPRGRRFLPLLLFACVAWSGATRHALGASADELRAALDAFTGAWAGELRIHAIDGYLLKTLQADRSYRWEGTEQVVETHFTDGEAAYESISRQYVALGRLQASVDRTMMPPERFSGEVSDGGIAWTNVERNSRDFREKIVARADSRTLEASSFEVIRLKGISGFVRLVFSLKPVPSVIGSTSRAGGPNPAQTARISALEKDLAAARALVDSAESRAAEFARERDSLRERLQSAETTASAASESTLALEAERDRLAATVADLRQRAAATPAPDALASARSASQTANNRILELQGERDALALRVEEADRRASELQTLLENAMVRLEQESEAAARARIDNDTLAAQLEQIDAERATLTARATSAEQSVERLSTERAGVSGDLASLERQLADARSEAERLRAEATNAIRQATDASNGAVKLQAERDSIARRLDEAEKGLAAGNDAKSTRAALEQRLAARDAEVAEFKKRLEQTVRDSETLTQAAESARAGRADLEAQVARLEAQEKQLAERNRSSAGDAAALKTVTGERDQLGGDLEQVRIQLKSAQTELAAARSSAESDAAHLKKLETDLAAAVTARAARDSELASLRANINAANNRASDLAHSLKLAENAAAETRSRLDQLQRDNEMLMRRAEAAGDETDRLTLRISELETDLKTAAQARAEASAGAEARKELQGRVSKLEADLAEARNAALSLQRERDALGSRFSGLEQRPDITAAALEKERQEAKERLQRAGQERLEALERAAESQKELATLSAAGAARGGPLDLQDRLDRAQKDVEVEKQRTEQLRAELDALASQAAAREKEAAELRAESARLEQGRQAAETRAAAVQERAGVLEALQDEVAALRVERDRERAASLHLQTDNETLSARIAQLQREPAGAERPPPASTGELSVSSLGTREQLVARIDRMDRRVLELESERNAARQASKTLGAQLADARRLRDDTLARFQDVVSQLNAVREERDRLTRANAALQAEARAAASSAPPAEGGESGGFLERFLASINGANPGGGAQAVEAMVTGLEVTNVDATPGRERATLNGRVFRPGETVDPGQGVVLERIEAQRLIFKDRRGTEYPRKF